MPAPCLFCRIVDRSQTAAIVYEDETSVAFLDHKPLFLGHILLILRAHVETLPDLPAAQVGPLFENARLLAEAVEAALNADGSFVAINNRVSQSVPHMHIHIVPRRKKDGLRGFFWPRTRYADDSERDSIRALLSAAIEGLQKPPGASSFVHD